MGIHSPPPPKKTHSEKTNKRRMSINSSLLLELPRGTGCLSVRYRGSITQHARYNEQQIDRSEWLALGSLPPGNLSSTRFRSRFWVLQTTVSSVSINLRLSTRQASSCNGRLPPFHQPGNFQKCCKQPEYNYSTCTLPPFHQPGNFQKCCKQPEYNYSTCTRLLNKVRRSAGSLRKGKPAQKNTVQKKKPPLPSS